MKSFDGGLTFDCLYCQEVAASLPILVCNPVIVSVCKRGRDLYCIALIALVYDLYHWDANIRCCRVSKCRCY